ncbi:MAG: ATP-binding protein [Pseudomonadota bacterium]
MADLVPGIIYVFNQKTQSNEYSNRSLGEMLGYTLDEIQAMGAEMLRLISHPDDFGKVTAHVQSLAQLRQDETALLEYRVKHRNGNWVWLLSKDAVFERDDQGQLLRHIGIATDITPQKEAEQRARDEILRARTTNEELRAFSYSVSHDMKAPANTLNLLLSELLDSHKRELCSDAVELLEMALMTVHQMDFLVANVVNYTRVIDLGMELVDVDLNAAFSEVVNELNGRITASDAVVHVSDLPTVRADALQIRILIFNLLENAIKFHRHGTRPQVWIKAEKQPEIKKCQVTIRDNGIGIHPAQHEKIFNVFKRLNASMEFDGTGLGLAICRRIAANHGSAISLASELSAGSTFGFELSCP